MQEHLKNISEIFINFHKQYKFNKYYLSIEGEVIDYVSSRFKISCADDLDDFTLKEKKHIESNLYGKVRDYLIKNNIKKTLYVKTNYLRDTCDGFEIYFKDALNIKL